HRDAPGAVHARGLAGRGRGPHGQRDRRGPPGVRRRVRMRPGKVSVVVTCYDLGRFLDEAVGSVLAQTYRDFEILIVDDGSTDPLTLELLAGYRRPRTTVVRTANHGLPAARNEGIRRTDGEFVCCLDADDR